VLPCLLSLYRHVFRELQVSELLYSFLEQIKRPHGKLNLRLLVSIFDDVTGMVQSLECRKHGVCIVKHCESVQFFVRAVGKETYDLNLLLLADALYPGGRLVLCCPVVPRLVMNHLTAHALHVMTSNQWLGLLVEGANVPKTLLGTHVSIQKDSMDTQIVDDLSN
jgi:hypothetical protein